jgi:hypothetical protein
MNVPTEYHYSDHSETGNEGSQVFETLCTMEDIKWSKILTSLTNDLLNERVNSCNAQESLVLEIIPEKDK